MSSYQPFSVTNPDLPTTSGDNREGTTSGTTLEDERNKESLEPIPVHLLVMIHGLWGTTEHLSYILKSILRATSSPDGPAPRLPHPTPADFFEKNEILNRTNGASNKSPRSKEPNSNGDPQSEGGSDPAYSFRTWKGHQRQREGNVLNKDSPQESKSKSKPYVSPSGLQPILYPHLPSTNEWTNTYDGIDFCAERVVESILETVERIEGYDPEKEKEKTVGERNGNGTGEAKEEGNVDSDSGSDSDSSSRPTKEDKLGGVLIPPNYFSSSSPSSSKTSKEGSSSRRPGKVVRISMVGYSLGGLIARYVLGLLNEMGFFENVEPVNFGTFASPAIGVPRYPGFWPFFLHFFGSRLLSRTGPQLYGTDKFLPSTLLPPPTSTTSGVSPRTSSLPSLPLLLLLSHPSGPFLPPLLSFPNISFYANAVRDMTVPFVTGCVEEVDWWRGAGELGRKRRERERKNLCKREGKNTWFGAEQEEEDEEKPGWGDLREGGIEVTLDPDYSPLISSYKFVTPIPITFPLSTSTSTKPAPSTTQRIFVIPFKKLGKSISRKVPRILRPSTNPWKFPFNWLVPIFFPVLVPAFFIFLLSRFFLQSLQSRKRIRRIQSTHQASLKTHESILARVGLGPLAKSSSRMARRASRVGGRMVRNVADELVEVEGLSGESGGGPASRRGSMAPKTKEGGDKKRSSGETEAVGNPNVAVNAQEDAKEKTTRAGGQTSALSSSSGGGGMNGPTLGGVDGTLENGDAVGNDQSRFRRRRTTDLEAGPAISHTSTTGTSNPATGGTITASTRPKPSASSLSCDRSLPPSCSSDSLPPDASLSPEIPHLTAAQKEAIEHLNSVPHLKKYWAFMPDMMNTHGAIIWRSKEFEFSGGRGRAVVDHWADNFLV